MKSRVVIFTDSRGRGLRHALGQIPGLVSTGILLKVRNQKGARFGDLLDNLRTDQRTQGYRGHRGDRTIAVISGGICGLTTLWGSEESQDLQIFYNSSRRNISRIKSKIDEIISYCQRRHIDLILTTISPACLIEARDSYIRKGQLRRSRYRYRTSELEEQQKYLEEDVNDLNDHITGRSTAEGLKYLNLNKSITKTSNRGKKRGRPKLHFKFTYERFTDGVHVNNKVKEEWFSKIGNLLKSKLFPEEQSSQGQPKVSRENTVQTVTREATEAIDISSQTDSQSENEAVAYKRRKRRQ